MESMSNSPFYLKRGMTPYGGINVQVRYYSLTCIMIPVVV